MSWINRDILQLYNNYFQEPYKIGWKDESVKAGGYYPQFENENSKPKTETEQGIDVRYNNHLGIEVYLPVELTDGFENGNTLKIDCATVRVTSKNTIIKTEVSERIGTVKEQFNCGDYVFTIKGVLISKDRGIPSTEIWQLKELAKNNTPVYLNNAYSEIFVVGTNRVVIESLEFPEQEGKHIRFRPFVMVCETDFIDTLIMK